MLLALHQKNLQEQALQSTLESLQDMFSTSTTGTTTIFHSPKSLTCLKACPKHL